MDEHTQLQPIVFVLLLQNLPEIYCSCRASSVPSFINQIIEKKLERDITFIVFLQNQRILRYFFLFPFVGMDNQSQQSTHPSSKAKSSPPTHSGKWTPEEEEYVECLIAEFKAGYLPLDEGTTLRSFLAKMLSCNPKRVSKKFEGQNFSGKLTFARNSKKISAEEVQRRRNNLSELERKYQESLQTLKQAETTFRDVKGRGRGASSSIHIPEQAGTGSESMGNMPTLDLYSNSALGDQYSGFCSGYGDMYEGQLKSAIARLHPLNDNPLVAASPFQGQPGATARSTFDCDSIVALRLRQQNYSTLIPPPNYQERVGAASVPIPSDMLRSQPPSTSLAYAGDADRNDQIQRMLAQRGFEHEPILNHMLAASQQSSLQDSATTTSARERALSQLAWQGDHNPTSPEQAALVGQISDHLKRDRPREDGRDTREAAKKPRYNASLR